MFYYLNYIVNSGEPTQKIEKNDELAIAYLLSMDDNQPISELVKIYYPFKLFETENGVMIFDLLEQTKTEISLLTSLEINEPIKGLVDNDDDKRSIIIGECRKLLDDFHYETVDVIGLANDIELISYLKTSEKYPMEQSPRLFKPILTEKKFIEQTKCLDLNRKETKNILGAHYEAVKTLQNAKEKIEKEHEKKYISLQKESEKNLLKLEKAISKEVEKNEKEHKLEIDEVNKDIDKKITEKNMERDKITQERDNIEVINSDSRKIQKKKDQILDQIRKTLVKYESEKILRVLILDQTYESKKKILKEKLENARHEEMEKIKDSKKNQDNLQTSIDECLNSLNQLISKLEEEVKNLSTYIDLNYLNGYDVLVPFYLHNKKNSYGLHPPIKETGEKRFSVNIKNLIFQPSLKDKTQKNVSPVTTCFSDYMKKVIDELNDDSKNSKEYRKTVQEINLLDSKLILEKILVGSYQLYKKGWINVGEYITAQKDVIERIRDQIQNNNEPYNIDTSLLIDTNAQESILSNIKAQ